MSIILLLFAALPAMLTAPAEPIDHGTDLVVLGTLTSVRATEALAGRETP